MRKPLYWIGSARKDLKRLPVHVQKNFGTALLDVQYGDTPTDARPLKHTGGARLWELVDDFDTNTFRAFYTVTFPGVVYVLHVFQKKSKRGLSTSHRDIELIQQRFRAASRHYASLPSR